MEESKVNRKRRARAFS